MSIIMDRYSSHVHQVEEEAHGGLRALAEVLLSYGERHFDGTPGQKGAKRGVWAGVLLMCGQFERVSPVAAFLCVCGVMTFC
jgi:hypothetical protein